MDPTVESLPLPSSPHPPPPPQKKTTTPKPSNKQKKFYQVKNSNILSIKKCSYDP